MVSKEEVVSHKFGLIEVLGKTDLVAKINSRLENPRSLNGDRKEPREIPHLGETKRRTVRSKLRSKTHSQVRVSFDDAQSDPAFSVKTCS
jgi:hypothetical protein